MITRPRFKAGSRIRCVRLALPRAAALASASPLRRIGSALGIRIAASRERHHRRLLKRIASVRKFDGRFRDQGGIFVSEDFITRLKAGNRGARFILYQWDSIRRVPDVARLLPYFDRVLSFDRRDCLQRPDFVFRPLFYRDAPSEPGHEPPPSYDLSFIGWLHSDRFSRLLDVEAEFRGRGLRMYIYLYTGIGTYLRHLIRGKHRLLHFRRLPFVQVAKIMAASKCILDLPHAEQNGLTMRTIEAIGMRRKLVTTNMDIVNYDFFVSTKHTSRGAIGRRRDCRVPRDGVSSRPAKRFAQL